MIKVKRVLSILCLIVMIFTVNVYAISCESIEGDAGSFIKAGKDGAETILDGKEDMITTPIVPIIQILLIIGTLVVGICLVILGIQWVVSKPSPEAQGKLKERFVALVIASAVMFGSYTVWSIVVGILSSLD